MSNEETPSSDRTGITGEVEITLRDENGDVKHHEVIHNMVTKIGNTYYAERATAVGTAPGQVTGMRLGTGTTTPAPTGAGASIVTYISGSNTASPRPAFTVVPVATDNGNARRVTWTYTWPAAQPTNSAITEAVITNEAGPTDVIGTAANTIARVTFGAVDKQALDTLTITWSHDLLGA